MGIKWFAQSYNSIQGKAQVGIEPKISWSLYIAIIIYYDGDSLWLLAFDIVVIN